MSTANLSAIALPLAWVTAISPHWLAAYLTFNDKDLKPFDNRCPREYVASVRALEKQTPVVKKYLRAEAAQQNGFENLPIFIATVVAANAARLPAPLINKFITVYLASRVVYNLLYIQTTRQKYTGIRSVVYVGGIATCSYIMYRAAQVWAKLPAFA
ncbi:hypothetical protein OIV83_002769 [Microbotryomycetes sp. JL201]|nr:hypothetical protein OIV83_002769 [Microbotryomycetes sp. JL201]